MGIKQLGGDCVIMDWNKSNFAISPIRFEATYVSRHLDLLMARLKRHDDDRALAESAAIWDCSDFPLTVAQM